MNNQLKRKAVIVTAALLSCFIAGTVVIALLQNDFTRKSQRSDMERKVTEIPKVIADAENLSTTNYNSFDNFNISNVKAVAYRMNDDAVFTGTPEQLKELAETMQVSNILILKRDGSIVAQSGSSAANFTYPRFNALRTVFSTGGTSDPFNVDIGKQSFRYYAARINDDTEAVIEYDNYVIASELSAITSIDSLLTNFDSGSKGFCIAVNLQDETMLYDPGYQYYGLNIQDLGLDPKQLTDGAIGTFKINGVSYYGGVCYVSDNQVAVICLMPEADAFSSEWFTIAVTAFVILAVLITLSVYHMESLEAIVHRSRGKDDQETWQSGSLEKMRKLDQKMLGFKVFGVICAFLVGFYMQNLAALSLVSYYQNQEVSTLAASNKQDKILISSLESQSDQSSISKARIAASILSNNPEKVTNEGLAEINSIISTRNIMVFDRSGTEIASTEGILNRTIGSADGTSFYAFRALMNGGISVADKIRTEGNVMCQYAGYVILNNGIPNGFAVVDADLTYISNITSGKTLLNEIKAIHSKSDGLILAVNEVAADNAAGVADMISYPADYAGDVVTEQGITASQMTDGFNGFVKFDGQHYYGRCAKIDSTYVFNLSTYDIFSADRMQFGFTAALCTIFSLTVLSALINWLYRKDIQSGQTIPDEDQPENEKNMYRGRLARFITGSAQRNEWNEHTDDRLTPRVIKIIGLIYMGLITIVVIFRNRLFGNESMVRYVLSEEWSRGLNMFSLTASLLLICVIGTAAFALYELVAILEVSMDSKGRTICRLVRSLIEYLSIILMLYYCLALFGVNTQALLASAGILAMAIGYGSREIVNDVMAGLFIIFDGEFAVGDYVQVADWKGTVIDVGVRTSKIRNDAGNIKIFSNGSISNIVNMSKGYKPCPITFTVDYGASIAELEKKLKEELPKMKEAVPAIKDMPTYTCSLTDNGMVISIEAFCHYADLETVRNGLNAKVDSILKEAGIERKTEPAAPAGGSDRIY